VNKINLEEALKKLKNVKQDNNGYTAMCPAHQDKHNSLCITEKGDKLLMKCQAGCSFVDILNCIKDTKHSSGNKVEEIYKYIDENGEIIHETVKGSNKKFYQRHYKNGEYIYNLKGVDTILYNLPDVIRAVKEGIDIYIPEGEKDCDNLKKLRFIATTNAMGAGKWRKEYNKYFKGAKNVIILPDNDKPGKEHAENVLKSLKDEVEKVKIVYLPGLKDKQDISDFIQKNGKEYTIEFLNNLTKKENDDNGVRCRSNNISWNILHNDNRNDNSRCKEDEVKKWYVINGNVKHFHALKLAAFLIKKHNLCLSNNSILVNCKDVIPEYKFKGEYILPQLHDDMTIRQVDDTYKFIFYILSV